jgi:2'-5' RNA ligase
MKTGYLSPIETGIFEYLLVANPDSEVHEKVMAEKQNFYDEYREKAAISTIPHITVTNFLAREAMEDTIIRWMERICSKQQSFIVTLNNYSGFPPHTIYLRVQNAMPFQQLAQELKAVNTYVSSCSCPPMNLISKPHVSISNSLSEEVYFKALTQYSHKSFHESFVVNELLLLRRKHPYDTCKPINVFGLQPGDNELFN